jgi:hypothetical protein
VKVLKGRGNLPFFIIPYRQPAHFLSAFGTIRLRGCSITIASTRRAYKMNGIIYLVGLVVVILAVLSFFGLR